MKSCDYGCGREATHQLKNGKWCCGSNISCCPEIRKKKIGRKRSDEFKLNQKNYMLNGGSKYLNSFVTEGSIEKQRQYMLNGGAKYINSLPKKGFNNHKEWMKNFGSKYLNSVPRDPLTVKRAVEKNRKIKEERGLWTKIEDLSNWDLYKRIVRKFSENSAKEQYSTEDLKQRGKNKNLNHKQLDHIFSIHEGFKLGILPLIIGSKSNIRLINCDYNYVKNSKCDITLEELFLKFDKEIKGKFE